MSAHPHEKPNWLMASAGLLLVGYLVLTAGWAFFTQAPLDKASEAQAIQAFQQQARAIGDFFDERRNDVARLARDATIRGYLVGDGREDAPGVLEILDAERNRIALEAVFLGSSLHRADGSLLLATLRPKPTPAWDLVPSEQPAILIAGDDAPLQIGVYATVFAEDRPVGFVAGAIAPAAIARLLGTAGGGAAAGTSALYAASGERIAGSEAREGRMSAPVPGTPFTLATAPGQEFGVFQPTMPWLLGAVLVAALAVALGLYALLQLRRQNRELERERATAEQQRKILVGHNQRLQNEIAKRIEHEKQLVHQANYDDLTKLPNRNLALDRLSQAIKRARRQKSKILVMFIDLDDFKQVNDTLGHQTGDRLLREAAARLAEAVRESDTVARLGGDEFLLICPDVASVAPAEGLAENVLEALHPPFLLDSHEFYVRASIGLALYPEDGDTAEQLLKNADVALYRAKDEGRNRFRFYTPAMDAFAQQRLVLEGRLRHAIKRDELRLLYQPIVDLADGRTVGVEALLRWENDALGAVSPAEFIPLAEDTGIIHELTRWVLEQSARQTEAWNRRHPLRVAINVSPKEFAGPDRLVELVDEVLAATGLPPNRLELEVTEGLLMHDYPATSGALQYLDKRHIRLSVDDFGTGYSALSYLQRFPFDTLKIDRSFVHGIEHDPASAALVRAILVMAKALGLDTVAEGVETKEQARFLAGHGCRYAQGYLFSPPLNAEQVPLHLSVERIPAA